MATGSNDSGYQPEQPEQPEVDEDGKPMRSFVPRRQERNQPPRAEYESGDKAYMYHDPPRKGYFIVTVASEGIWHEATQQIVYQLRVGNGTELCNGGGWIAEDKLMASPPI